MTNKQDYVLCFIEHHQKDAVIYVLKDKPQAQAGMINLPGGKIELTDKSPTDAAYREVAEECGLLPDKIYYIGECGKIVGDWGRIYCFFISTKPDFDIKPGKDETETFFWDGTGLPLRDKRCMPNLKLINSFMHFGFRGWTITDDNQSHPYKVQVTWE